MNIRKISTKTIKMEDKKKSKLTINKKSQYIPSNKISVIQKQIDYFAIYMHVISRYMFDMFKLITANIFNFSFFLVHKMTILFTYF